MFNVLVPIGTISMWLFRSLTPYSAAVTLADVLKVTWILYLLQSIHPSSSCHAKKTSSMCEGKGRKRLFCIHPHGVYTLGALALPDHLPEVRLCFLVRNTEGWSLGLWGVGQGLIMFDFSVLGKMFNLPMRKSLSITSGCGAMKPSETIGKNPGFGGVKRSGKNQLL